MTLERIYQKAREIAERFSFPWEYIIEVTANVNVSGSHYHCKLYPLGNISDEACISGQVCPTPAEALHEFKTVLDEKQSNL